ncbi:CbtA family protein [Williamsia sterculiae]|uniref:Probable cobalt transporter subunit (CbtA) n=1 Tax=Williamsia sterculiae TaxID=1344003 RepID=A0A1N7H1S9_9NOCA|nr:CbtA family protein [Williamsia sterculiae]SIS18807.1 Probable cobalt transporter subunit (CbtA) [Williamsia sterculiae]
MEKRNIAAGLLAGLVAGIVSFCYARLFVEPQVRTAIAYEGGRSHAAAALSGAHEHDHEVFSRAVQENVGAGVGTIVFAAAMGAVFAVAFTLLWSYLGKRYPATDARWVAAATAAALFVAVYLTPFAVYPANPPSVGDGDTIDARSGAYLGITVVSVIAMVVAVTAAVLLRARINGLLAATCAAVGYTAVVAVAAALLPRFDEVPRPLTVPSGDIVFPGFPAETLADFRLHAIGVQLVLWVVMAAVFSVVIGRRRTPVKTSSPANISAPARI